MNISLCTIFPLSLQKLIQANYLIFSQVENRSNNYFIRNCYPSIPTTADM